MPPKNPKGAGSKAKPKEEKREDALQAVVLADSFEKRFAPFTLDGPRCLLPLANVPLIEYTLEFLANAGVEEIFVYCGAHTDQVEEYLNSSKWKRSASPFTALTIVRSTATSAGDALRDIDSRGYITGDFLLVAGDVVANVALEPALARHRARREKDKNAIMTMLLREAGPSHRTAPLRNQPVFVLAPATDRCLWYDEMWATKNSGHHLELDPEFLAEHSEIEVRSDLLDCSVDICTPDVLSLWSENFDFNSVRRGFLRGVLKDYELNGKTFHTHILRTGYAARVRDLRTYAAVSRDIVGRWTYPITPDSNVFAGQTYTLGKNNVYLEDGVSLARGSEVQRRSVVGHGTSVGADSIVTDSIVGHGCRIGRNVTIRGAYLWANCEIGDGTTVDGSVLADGVVVGKQCTVVPGCLVAAQVRIADSTTLAPGTRLTRVSTRAPGSADGASPAAVSGNGHVYESPSSSATSSPAASPLLGATAMRRDSIKSTSSISTLHSHATSPSTSRRPSSSSLTPFLGASDPSAESAILLTDSDKASAQKARMRRDFLGEASASVYDGLATHEPADKIRLELVAQRLAADAGDAAVRDALVIAFLRRTWALLDGSDSSSATAMTPATAVKAVWGSTYGWLLAQMGMFDTGATAPAAGSANGLVKPDQVAVLSMVEAAAAAPERAKGKEVLLFVVREGIEGGWLQVDGVREWWERGGAEAEAAPVRVLVAQYVEYLFASSEEESSEEDEDESESE